MDDYQNEAMPVGAAEVAAATQTLQRYKAGKAALDRRLVDNELWFRMGHWKNYQNPMMPARRSPAVDGCSTASPTSTPMPWTTTRNPMCCPVQRTMRQPRGLFPACCRWCWNRQITSRCTRLLVAQAASRGTGVTGVFWDPAARGGVGDIAVRAMNLLMLYWEPGVADIQDSPEFFQPEPGGHRTAHGPLPAAGRPHRRGAGCAPLHPRGRRGHRFPQCGGGLVL